MISSYVLYLLRWQLSTPVLAMCVVIFSSWGNLVATLIANLIGGLLFFWVDRVIFGTQTHQPIWSVVPNSQCSDCGRVGRGYRLVRTANYNRSSDPHPKYRCESCSQRKLNELKKQGIQV